MSRCFLGGNWQVRRVRTRCRRKNSGRWSVARGSGSSASSANRAPAAGYAVVLLARPGGTTAAATVSTSVFPANGADQRGDGPLPVPRSMYRGCGRVPHVAFLRRNTPHGSDRPACRSTTRCSARAAMRIGCTIEGTRSPKGIEPQRFDLVDKDTRARAASPPREQASIRSCQYPPWCSRCFTSSRSSPRKTHIRTWLAPQYVLLAGFLLLPGSSSCASHHGSSARPSRPYRCCTGPRAARRSTVRRDDRRVTLIFVVTSVALPLGLGLLIAWLLDAAEQRRWRLADRARRGSSAPRFIPASLIGVISKILPRRKSIRCMNFSLWMDSALEQRRCFIGTLAVVSVIVADACRSRHGISGMLMLNTELPAACTGCEVRWVTLHRGGELPGRHRSADEP